MTTYEINSDANGHHLVASWPDLPERATCPVATFGDLKLASVARSVLGAASRYRWKRWVQLLDSGVFTEQEAGPDPTNVLGSGPLGPPRLPTAAVLGDSPMSATLETRIAKLISTGESEPEHPDDDSPEFTDRVRFGSLQPLLWTDWRSHLLGDQHDRLTAELDAELAATMTPTTARGRQIAWYLSAELLIDEDYSSLVPQTSGEAGKHHADAFQTSLVQLLSDLTGLRAESTAIEWDPEVEALLRVHSPATVVGFWLDQESWYYGWPDPDAPDAKPTVWRHAGSLPVDTSIGELAELIAEATSSQTWPFGGQEPTGKPGIFSRRNQAGR
jgi:hypothetical protein